MYKTMKSNAGVTFLELMVVIAIIGILAAIAIPSYQSYAQESRRSEGMAELMRMMDLQERVYSNSFPPSYTTTLTDLGYAANTVVSENSYYSIQASACAGSTIANCVILTATAQNAQAGDGNLTLDSLGNRQRGGNDGWD